MIALSRGIASPSCLESSVFCVNSVSSVNLTESHSRKLRSGKADCQTGYSKVKNTVEILSVYSQSYLCRVNRSISQVGNCVCCSYSQPFLISESCRFCIVSDVSVFYRSCEIDRSMLESELIDEFNVN